VSRIPPDGEFALPPEGDAGIERMPVEEPKRAASLTLRSDAVREERIASMEAANRSLADALRITYRLIQLVMVALVVMFLFSGFQQVNQSESGIRIEFGKVKADQLEPGFQFSLPYPLGEIIKVEKGNRAVEVDDTFWPAMSPEQRRKPLSESGVNADSLDPTKDGSLLTADSNIAHAQFTVVYLRSKPAEFVKNLSGEEFETPLVQASVQRAAVHVAASVTIDELLKPGAGAGGENSVESRVRALAQQLLDQVHSGLEIQQVSLRSVTPPMYVRRDFNQVQIAQSNAGKAREQALGDRAKLLNEGAGTASDVLLDLIDAYEAAIELNDEKKAEGLLGEIDRVLLGEADGVNVAVNGMTYASVRLSGEVARMISDAQQYRSTVVQRAQRQAEMFRAKLKSFRANPAVFLTGALADGLNAFLAHPNVEQVFWLSPSTDVLDLRLSPDPAVAREKEKQKYEMDVEGNVRVKEMREALE
jgi:membrane protease subunit HflK